MNSQISSTFDQDKGDTFIETCDDKDYDECDAYNDETFGDCFGDEDLGDWEKEHEKFAGMETNELEEKARLSNGLDLFSSHDENTSNNLISKISENLNYNQNVNLLNNFKSELLTNNHSYFHETNQPEKVENKLNALEFQEKLNLASYSPFLNTSTCNTYSSANLLENNSNVFKTPIKGAQNCFWNTNTPNDRVFETEPFTPILSKTKTLEEVEKELFNKNIIKRPIRAEDLEAILLSSDSNRKTLASMENSQINVSDNYNLDPKSSGWSPFSTEDFISNINLEKSFNINTPKDENTKPNNAIKKLGLISSPQVNNAFPFSEEKLKKFITVDELEKSMLNMSKMQDQPKTPTSSPSSFNENQQTNLSFNPLNKPNTQDHNVTPNFSHPNLLSSNHPSFQPLNLSQLNPYLFTNNFPANRSLFPRLLPLNNLQKTSPKLTTAPAVAKAPNSIIHRSQLPQFSQYQQKFQAQRRQLSLNRSRNNHFNFEKDWKNDDYAGLMTQRDKEWLIKIQNLQLHFDDPYKEDYYFVTFNSRKLTEAAKEINKGKNLIPSLIIPERSKLGTDNKANSNSYEPQQFEGSLGKIQVSNVNFPRKLLDLDGKLPYIDNSDRTIIGRAELNNFRKLLLDIENLYVIMLNIDEEDKKMGALPEETKAAHLEKRNELCLKLFRGIYDEKNDKIHNKILSIHKGCTLIFRSLLVLSNSVHKFKIIKYILQNNNLENLTSKETQNRYSLNYGQILSDGIKSLNKSESDNYLFSSITSFTN